MYALALLVLVLSGYVAFVKMRGAEPARSILVAAVINGVSLALFLWAVAVG